MDAMRWRREKRYWRRRRFGRRNGRWEREGWEPWIKDDDGAWRGDGEDEKEREMRGRKGEMDDGEPNGGKRWKRMPRLDMML